jgi:hypothetical protein
VDTDAPDAIGGLVRFSGVFGDGVKKTLHITHNLGTEDIVVSLWSTVTKEMLSTEVVVVNSNEVDLIFAVVPPRDSVKVVVLAAGGSGQFAGAAGADGSAGLVVHGDTVSTFEGPIMAPSVIVQDPPTSSVHAVNKGYVDQLVATTGGGNVLVVPSLEAIPPGTRSGTVIVVAAGAPDPAAAAATASPGS